VRKIEEPGPLVRHRLFSLVRITSLCASRASRSSARRAERRSLRTARHVESAPRASIEIERTACSAWIRGTSSLAARSIRCSPPVRPADRGTTT
jgi:hypothetical protein